MIHMSSVLPQKQDLVILPTDWIFYEEMTRAGTLACIRCCTAVSAVSVAIFAGPAKLPPNAVKEGGEEGRKCCYHNPLLHIMGVAYQAPNKMRKMNFNLRKHFIS